MHILHVHYLHIIQRQWDINFSTYFWRAKGVNNIDKKSQKK